MTTLERTTPSALREEEREQELLLAWMDAQRYTPKELFDDGVKAVAEAVASGEMDEEKAAECLRILASEYLSIRLSEQINGYLKGALERGLGLWDKGTAESPWPLVNRAPSRLERSGAR